MISDGSPDTAWLNGCGLSKHREFRETDFVCKVAKLRPSPLLGRKEYIDHRSDRFCGLLKLHDLRAIVCRAVELHWCPQFAPPSPSFQGDTALERSMVDCES